MRSLVRPIITLLLTMGGCALLAGAAGYVLGRLEALVLVDRLASQVPRDRHARFLADGAAHLPSYESVALPQSRDPSGRLEAAQADIARLEQRLASI